MPHLTPWSAPTTTRTPDPREVTLDSVSASIELALLQIERGELASAREILGEAMREAQGASLDLH